MGLSVSTKKFRVFLQNYRVSYLIKLKQRGLSAKLPSQRFFYGFLELSFYKIIGFVCATLRLFVPPSYICLPRLHTFVLSHPVLGN
jgi:hypothetical protein